MSRSPNKPLPNSPIISVQSMDVECQVESQPLTFDNANGGNVCDVTCESVRGFGSPSKDARVATERETMSSVTSSELTPTGLKVLILLALQNCSKNLLTRYVMSGAPKFLLSAAVIGSELTKLTLSTLYILVVERHPLTSIGTFLREDNSNSKLLVVPASVYNLQQTLEFVALSNLDASVFSVLVQSKLMMTAIFSVALMGRRLRKAQVISLTVLTVGVILCNLKVEDLMISSSLSSEEKGSGDGKVGVAEGELSGTGETSRFVGISATLGIAFASGFASVYTEKVLKKKRKSGSGCGTSSHYSLAYMQVQLAMVSLGVMGTYALLKDSQEILQHGLWHNFTVPALLSVFWSGVGGLTVAAVLKYADAVLKGYATAVSVVLTGVLSAVLFGTNLGVLYGMGIVNVVSAVILYNAGDLDAYMC